MADARADAVRVASEPDAWLARSLVITARQMADDGRVLQSAAWPPLVALLEQSARGDLSRHEWRSAMHEALPRTPGTPARSVGQLMDDLATTVPPGAHAVRVRRALDTGNRDARELVLLLQGALIAADATLQLELLAQLRALALAPLGILGLLQEPFLLRALDSVSATAADPDESAHTRHVLAAAELARRGDQRGARHGCVLIDGEGHVLGEGFNHEATTVAGGGRKRIVHAEAHALADAIRRRGDDGAWAACGSASAYIVELSGTAGYDDAPPCRKCELLLRAFGVRRAMHTTRDGRLCVRELGGGGVTAAGGCSRAGRPLLEVGMACVPLLIACESVGVRSERLKRALENRR